MASKPKPPKADEIVKVFKGLAIAASRARAIASEYGRERLRENLSRHQRDALRQNLLDIENDVKTVLDVMTHQQK